MRTMIIGKTMKNTRNFIKHLTQNKVYTELVGFHFNDIM
jgi:hypothetical protein